MALNMKHKLYFSVCFLIHFYLTVKPPSRKKNREKIISAIQTDSRLEGIRILAKASDTTLDIMLKELEKNVRTLESVCRP